MGATEDIAAGLDKIVRSAFVSGHTKKSYEDGYPAESAKVFSYLGGGTPPSPWPTTLMGDGLSLVERGRRALAAPPPPPPPPPGAADSAPTAVVA